MKYFVTFTLILLMPMASNAQTTPVDASSGSIIVGPDTRSCVAGLAGALRYNSTTKKIEVCNGTAWSDWGQ